jgi:septation ring formation regulator EzrA
MGAGKMKHKRHFDNGAVSREALQTRILIADIGRVVQIIESDIAAEEQQTGVFDRCQVEYPILARNLAARRDNLKGTIAELEKRLSAV